MPLRLFILSLRCFLLLLFLLILTSKGHAEGLMPKGTWIAKSTVINLAKKNRDIDTGNYAYIPAGTRFIAYSKTVMPQSSEKYPRIPRRLILTETGLWGYIMDKGCYWKPKEMTQFKEDTVIIQNYKRVTNMIDDDCRQKYVKDLKIDDSSQAISLYNLYFTRSEKYTLKPNPDDIVGDVIEIKLTPKKLEKRWNDPTFPKTFLIPRDIATIITAEEAEKELFEKDIPYFYCELENHKPYNSETDSYPRINILFVSSNPRQNDKGKNFQYQIDPIEEERAIKEEIEKCKYKQAIKIETANNARPSDLTAKLQRYKPWIFHFSGHGESLGIWLQDDNGRGKLVDREALKRDFLAFKELNKQSNLIKIAFFSACQTEKMAEALKDVVDCAIGMEIPINDKTGVIYSKTFYRYIGNGESVEVAHKLAQTALMNEGERGGYKAPKIYCRTGLDPAKYKPLEIISRGLIGQNEKYGKDCNISRWLFTKNNGKNEIYEITKTQCRTKTQKIIYSYKNPDYLWFEFDENYCDKKIFTFDNDSGRAIITKPNDYFKAKDFLTKRGFKRDELNFIISKCIEIPNPCSFFPKGKEWDDD